MSHRVLILGGHGKIAQLLTPLLLKRSWNVTSVIRAEDQVSTIKALDTNNTGRLNVLVRSLEEVKSEDQAKAIIKESEADYVVWSAGAGGKGGSSRTYAIDRDAATHFISAIASTPSVKKFILVSFVTSRRSKASWWSEEAWKKSINGLAPEDAPMHHYYEAKVAADEALYRLSQTRKDGLEAIDLRPGTLTEEEGGGVALGQTAISGKVSRKSVARVTDALLARESGVGSRWLDLLDGDEDVEAAVERVVKENVDVVGGEPVTKE